MKDSERNRAIIAEVVARAWREPEYMSQFRQNPKQVLENAGASIAEGLEVVLLENTATVIHAVLPPMGEMERYQSRLQKAMEMLSNLPEDMEVHIHRDSKLRAFIVLPEMPAEGGELSDAQLEQVAGGKGGGGSTANVTNSVNVAEAVNVAVAAAAAAGAVDVAGAVVAVVVPCFVS